MGANTAYELKHWLCSVSIDYDDEQIIMDLMCLFYMMLQNQNDNVTKERVRVFLDPNQS